MEMCSREFNQSEKDDSSPLTEADLAATHLIIQELFKVSTLPVPSEERDVPAWSERSKWQ